MKLVPITLEFLLHCRYSSERFSRIDHPVIQKAIKGFFSNGVIKQDRSIDDVYQLTEKGEAWIKDILSTPMPIQVWMSGRQS